jgi:hypothetical protein
MPKNYNPRKLSIHLVLCTLLMIVLSSSCKKKDNSPESPSPVMTITFTGNYINPDLGAIVFISDKNGKTIADTSVTGNSKVVIYPLPGVTVPDRFTVTIVSWEPGMHNFTITLNSFMEVSKGEWMTQGHRADTTGHFTFSMSFIPPHTGPILYSTAGSSNLTFLTTGLDNWLYREQDALYILLKTTSGPKFSWTYGYISQPQEYLIDLSAMEDAKTQAVTLPFVAQNYLATLRGFSVNNYETPLNWRCDEVISEGMALNTIPLAYPDGKFAGFSTEIEIAEDFVTPYTYTYHVNGSIPPAFRKIEAAMSLQSVGKGAATINASGTFTVTGMSWEFNAQNRQAYVWNVYAPDSVRTIHLPALSTNMKSMFPDLAIDSLSFVKSELTEYWTVQSYEEMVSMLFSPANPHTMDYFERSSIRVVPGK